MKQLRLKLEPIWDAGCTSGSPFTHHATTLACSLAFEQPRVLGVQADPDLPVVVLGSFIAPPLFSLTDLHTVPLDIASSRLTVLVLHDPPNGHSAQIPSPHGPTQAIIQIAPHPSLLHFGPHYPSHQCSKVRDVLAADPLSKCLQQQRLGQAEARNPELYVGRRDSNHVSYHVTSQGIP